MSLHKHARLHSGICDTRPALVNYHTSESSSAHRVHRRCLCGFRKLFGLLYLKARAARPFLLIFFFFLLFVAAASSDAPLVRCERPGARTDARPEGGEVRGLHSVDGAREPGGVGRRGAARAARQVPAPTDRAAGAGLLAAGQANCGGAARGDVRQAGGAPPERGGEGASSVRSGLSRSFVE